MTFVACSSRPKEVRAHSAACATTRIRDSRSSVTQSFSKMVKIAGGEPHSTRLWTQILRPADLPLGASLI